MQRINNCSNKFTDKRGLGKFNYSNTADSYKKNPSPQYCWCGEGFSSVA
jgi:hypothetical protein